MEPVNVRSPRVSLGLPAYMASRWITRCLESVLAQTVEDFELIISDNCSSDDTWAICQSFAARDRRIRVFRQARNIGISANHNLTYLQGRAPFFCWLSANDVYHVHFLERCLEVLDSSPDVVLAACRANTFSETPGDGERLAEARLPDLKDPRKRLYRVMSSTLATSLFRGVFRRSAIGQRTPLQPMFGTDLILVVEMACVGRIVQIDEPLYFVRISTGAWTTSVPLHLRAQYYEPQSGASCILFHRSRVLATYWRIAMRETGGGWRRLAAILPMLRVMFDLYRMPVRDVREATGLAWALAATSPRTSSTSLGPRNPGSG